MSDSLDQVKARLAVRLSRDLHPDYAARAVDELVQGGRLFQVPSTGEVYYAPPSGDPIQAASNLERIGALIAASAPSGARKGPDPDAVQAIAEAKRASGAYRL